MSDSRHRNKESRNGKGKQKQIQRREKDRTIKEATDAADGQFKKEEFYTYTISTC